MRNTITRTITVNTIRIGTLSIENGAPVVKEFEPLKAYGNIDNKTAQKMARKAHKEAVNVVVLAIEPKEQLFEISVEDFIKNAKAVNDDTPTDTDEPDTDEPDTDEPDTDEQ